MKKYIGRNILWVVLAGAVILLAYMFNVVEPADSKSEELATKKEAQVMPEAAGVVPFVLGCETYEPVAKEALPQEVRSAIATRYVAYAISNVFKDHEDNYKVVLKNQNSKMIAFYTADGEYLKQEVVKPVQVVALN